MSTGSQLPAHDFFQINESDQMGKIKINTSEQKDKIKMNTTKLWEEREDINSICEFPLPEDLKFC